MTRSHAPAPLQRRRADWIAVGVISLVVVLVVAAAFLTAPIRSTELSSAAHEVEVGPELDTVPGSVSEVARVPDASPALRPVVVDGLIAGLDGTTLRAFTPAGDEVWAYTRHDELCALASAWGKVVATYHANAGCGDVVAIEGVTGTYAGTRASIAPDEVVSVSSNDRVGTVGIPRTELWRSDMVRTVEYGEVEAEQEADAQPHPECNISSALTRTDLFAVTENCHDGTWLRLQDTTPEDSRQPEILANKQFPPGSFLVGIGQTAAAVYDAQASEFVTVDTSGTEISRTPVPPLGEFPPLVEPATADLPHHMSFHDGSRLYLLNPSTLAVTAIFEGALGTGVAVGGRLLFPVENGIAVASWDTQRVERIIPVDRGSYSGPVTLNLAGETLVEKRGEELVFLQP